MMLASIKNGVRKENGRRQKRDGERKTNKRQSKCIALQAHELILDPWLKLNSLIDPSFVTPALMIERVRVASVAVSPSVICDSSCAALLMITSAHFTHA